MIFLMSNKLIWIELNPLLFSFISRRITSVYSSRNGINDHELKSFGYNRVKIMQKSKFPKDDFRLELIIMMDWRNLNEN